MVLYIITVTVMLVSIGSCKQLTQYEIENVFIKTEPGRISKRAGASGGHSVYMKQGDSVEIKICPKELVGINIDEVFYSNDGWFDQVDIHVDGQYVDSFWSDSNVGGYGNFWNIFKSSGKVGPKIMLSSGYHTIELYVVFADMWGIELDRIVLKTDSAVDENTFWCS